MREMITIRDGLERARTEEFNGRCWICLRAKPQPQGSAASAMCGPYTRNEIVNLLMTGELAPSDYVWREGYSHWKLLSSMDQLQLPIPGFPRRVLAWTSGTLDWNARKNVTPPPAPPTISIAKETPIADRILDGAIVLVCAMLGWVLWQLATHYRHAHTSAARPAAAHAPAGRSARPTPRPPARPTARSTKVARPQYRAIPQRK